MVPIYLCLIFNGSLLRKGNRSGTVHGALEDPVGILNAVP